MENLCLSEGCQDDRSKEPRATEAAQEITSCDNRGETTSLHEADMTKLQEWNSTVPESVNECIHELISERCRAQVDAIAICAWDGDLTYNELDNLSSALAVHLAEYGVGAEVFVPLCFEKSRWAAVAVLGVLKAGGAFVMLDPSQPLSRLQDLCSNVDASLLLCSLGNKRLGQKIADRVVVVSSVVELSCWRGSQKHGLTVVIQPHNAAYASFTSGSTGRPKAVVVEHSAICSNTLAHIDKLHLHTESRVLQSASYAFGASILQIIMTLVAGGCVCIPSESECQNNLAAAARKLRVNWALFTPSFLRVVRPDDFPDLKHITLGGEPPSRGDIRAWADHVQVSGAYGSAECAIVCATAQDMRALSDPRSIGEMTGSVGWIVNPDDHNQLLPPGTVGELLVEGPNLARGYLNDTSKTAEAFIEAPRWFSQYCKMYNKTPRRGGRMYKTGDLASYNADGSLTCVGRKDTQVQIHGQRVELGEVEHHIRGNLSSDDAPQVVAEVIKPHGSDHPMLIAYFAIGETANDSPDRVRAALETWVQGMGDRLAEQLPRYMVPSAYLALNTIPMTATGKTDRRRLRKMGSALTRERLAELLLPSRSVECAPPTATERQLRKLWARVLNLSLDKISTGDNFLRIGGDSIAAVQLVGAARDQGLSMTVTDIFNAPHLCEMALIVKAAGYRAEQTIPPFSLLPAGTETGVAKAQAASQCGVDTKMVEDIFPCTPLQEGMLAMTTKRPGDYVKQTVLQLSGDVDVASLERAWREAIASITILRTRIVDLPVQGLVQVVVAEQDILTVTRDIEWYLRADNRKPMGLGTHLSRLAIIDGSRPVVVWTIHHALLDGWSMPLVLEQVEQAYHGRTRDRLVPFQGFVRHILQSTKSADEYWKSQLSGSEALPFPSLPSCSYQTKADHVVQYRISKLQWPQNNITPSTVVRTAWALLLGQYTSMADVTFGTTVTGRQMPVSGVERMVGPTIATVPVRVRWQWETDIQDLFQQVQTQGAEMTQYEQMGLQHIRQVSPDAEQACQFQSLLVVQPMTQENRDKGQDQRFEVLVDMEQKDDYSTWINGFNTYAIMLECHLKTEGLHTRISFDSHVMDKVQVQRIAYQLEQTLREVSAQRNGPLPIRDICALSDKDRQQLEEWNGTVPQRVSRCIHELIQDRIRVQPDSLAICSWDGDFTYAEIDQLSSALATHLAALGVGPEIAVPLCFDKSRWVPVAMLGVMKSGGSFVLLDPSHPRAWLRDICQTVSGSVVVVSVQHKAMMTELLPDTVKRVVVVGPDKLPWRQTSTPRLLPSVTPDNAMFVVFTSGSTGSPKGVVISHASFCSSILPYCEALGLDQNSRLLQFTSYAFDSSIMEMHASLISGGCITVPCSMTQNISIANSVGKYGATWTFLTPSMLRTFEPEWVPEWVPTLKTLLVGGEVISPTELQKWSSRMQVVNIYGPAECSVVSTIHTRLNIKSQNLGKPTGCVLWIVDPQDHGRLLPIGAVGELLIEGPIVGRGYLKNPAETATAFIKPPAWLRDFRGGHPTTQNSRLYKTGDLVRYMADGSLCFVARKDSQVKLRGQRIELAQVEHHTRQCFPGAWDVVADVILAEPGRSPILVVFICRNRSQGDQSTAGEENILLSPTDAFRAAIPVAEALLHEVVPAFMVPSVFLPLRAIPLTGTGKTDRHWLRNRVIALSQAEVESYRRLATAKRMPATAAEQMLQQLWARVLNVSPESIGLDDSFFRLGGDSIAAMQVSARAQASGYSLDVGDILRSKTIGHLSKFLATRTPLVLEAQETIGDTFGLSPIQTLFLQLEPHGPNYFNQSFLVPLVEQIDFEDLSRAIHTIVTEHPMLHARFCQSKDGRWTQVISDQIQSSYRCQSGTYVSLEAARETIFRSQESLDIRNGPLLAVNHINVGILKQYVFLVAHHLVIDLVSWRIILGDLEELLQGGTLPGVRTLPFQSWCRLQADYISNYVFAKAHSSNLLSPPYEYWSPVIAKNRHGDTLHRGFAVGKELTTTLLGSANEAFQTQPVEILQAVLWYSFVQTFIDRSPPTIFNEGHGRESWDSTIDLSRTVGWFTTIWPTFMEMGSDRDNLVEVVRWTKDARRRASSIGWKDFTARLLGPDRERSFESYGPVEIAFNYLGRYQQFEREDALLRPPISWKDQPPDVAADVGRFALIDVVAVVEQGRLQFSFTWGDSLEHQDRINRWIGTCEKSLTDVVELLTHMEPESTLFDFPLLTLSYSELSELLTRAKSRETADTSCRMANIEDVYPCTPMQHFLIHSQRRKKECFAPIHTFEVRSLTSHPVDLFRIQEAWETLVDRHASLRTVIVSLPGTGQRFFQVALKSARPNISYLNCASDHDTLLALQAHPPPTYDEGKLLHQLVVAQNESEKTYIRLDMHHAIIDATSLSLLLMEWRLAYTGELPRDKALPFSAYISRALTTEIENKNYWENYLTHTQPCLFPVVDNLEWGIGTIQYVDIELDLANDIHALCHYHEITVAGLIRATWALVLHKWTGRSSVCFAYFTSGRHVSLQGVDRIMGALVSLIVCRVDIGTTTTLDEIMKAVHDDYNQSLPHYSGTPPAIADRIDMSSSKRLLNTLVNHRRHGSTQAGGDISFELVSLKEASEFDVVLQIDERGNDIQLRLRYWNGRIPESVMQEVAMAFNDFVSLFLDSGDKRCISQLLV